MKVWIDQDLCTGDAQCVDICPDVFFMHEDESGYRCYVRDVGGAACGPDGEPKLKMGGGLADVPRTLEDAVDEAAECCPGECIFLERASRVSARPASGPNPRL
jgi:ferredoxin